MLNKSCPVCQNKRLTYRDDFLECENCHAYKRNLNFLEKQFNWAKNISFWWRIIILFLFALMLIQNWKDPWFSIHQSYNPLVLFDFGIHELGHPIFGIFGTFIYTAGGSIFQCLFPILWIFAFYRIRWFFASAMCWGWLGINIFSVAAYANDARARLLPLGGWGALSSDGSDAAYDQGHDWYQILSRLHHLEWDHTISNILVITGSVIYIIGLILGALIIYISIYSHINKLKNKDNR